MVVGVEVDEIVVGVVPLVSVSLLLLSLRKATARGVVVKIVEAGKSAVKL